MLAIVARGGAAVTILAAGISSAERPEPVVGVELLAVVGVDPTEKVPGAGNVARPFVEVGQGVPLPQVMEARLLDGGVALQELDGPREVASVGQRSGHDDPALGHDLGT